MTQKSTQSAARRVSSTTSTGGAGTLFEQQVDTAFLSLLLVRGIPPVLSDCTVTEVHLQTERQGWSTDDILVVAENGGGTRRRLIGQVKLKFTVSASDDECTGTIGDFWDDYCGRSDFSFDSDAFAIIVLRGTNTLLGHFASLLDCARAANDAADFDTRLTTPGFVNATVMRYFEEIQTIVEEHAERKATAEEMWRFLKTIHVISMDLGTSTRQSESLYKSMLAHTAIGTDPLGAAATTWNELLHEAGEGMAHGKSYRRSDLPHTALDRHTEVPDSSHSGLRRLREHSEVILNGIRSTIGSTVHLKRNELIQRLLESIEQSQIVLVTGPAGGGKSGVAKEAILQLRDHFTFSFRAEEFATAHLDATLQNSQIPANTSVLVAMMAGQSRKLLLVESVERLLEASTRDAFTDLVALLKNDSTWRLVLTCRDYSSELVRSSLLQFAAVEHSVLAVPPLDDTELAEVEAELPALSRPLSSTILRRLLRNPYVLDKASQMDWPADRPLPADERAFRAKFWAEIIRADDRPAGDMPRRRQDALVEIALRRARALTQFVPRGDINTDAIRSLCADSLIVYSEESDALVAPAHDVLEDWSIFKWIEEQYVIGDRALRALASTLGSYPAIRRTYRKWVSELVVRDPNVADSLFVSTVQDPSLSPHFRDDTLVALMQSEESGDLLQRHTSLLVANDLQVLRRIIHLLRVACVTTPPWFGGGGDVASIMHVPDGAIWKAALQLVSENLSLFMASDAPLIVGFVEDAARGVNWQTPYPEGVDFISRIAFELLPVFAGYESEEQRKRLLKIIAKLPKCNPEGFTRLLEGEPNGDGGDSQCEEFREIVLWAMEGVPACRDLPNSVIAAVRDELLISEETLSDWNRYGGIDEVDDAFGIEDGHRHECFPASALCGPFLQLLMHHTRQALDFLIDLFNYSGDWYGNHRIPVQVVEPPYEITLTFSDGSQKKQWCNSRLWNLYRGTSVGPYVLQSALMALERFLLSLAEQHPSDLDQLLCSLLRQSSNAAVTAVISSVATAHPRITPETLLVLLSSPECILLDRGRMTAEPQAQLLSGMGLLRTPTQRIAEGDRRQANEMGHRRHDLEAAIANAQLGRHAKKFHDMIDAYREAIAPAEKRTDEDRIWWLALHRMDLRKYTVVSQVQEDPQTSVNSDETSDAQPQMIRFDLQQAEPDVQQMIDANQEDYQAMNARLAVLMWGIKVFAREDAAQYDPSLWRHQLEACRAAKGTDAEEGEADIGRGGPEHVASVCIRDHYDELTAEEVSWCIETVCLAVENDADNWNDLARKQRFSMRGDRPSAYVLSYLMVNEVPHALRERVQEAFAMAILHPVDEVRQYAVFGAGQHLWERSPDLALRCTLALATEARMVQKQWRIEQERPFSERLQYGAIEAAAAAEVRNGFYGNLDEDAYEQLDIRDWTGSEANSRILGILKHAPAEECATNAFRRLAAVIADWWDEDDQRQRGRRNRRERSIDVAIALTGLLEEFVLKVTPQKGAEILSPILAAIDRHPKSASEILQGIIGAEDRYQETAKFWSLWKLFADRVKTAPWLARLDDRYPTGAPMLATVFMTQYWKEDVRHWRSLEGYDSHVHDLFRTLPPSSLVLDNYLRFLYHIGERSLPFAFRHVAERLQAGETQEMLVLGNTTFMLESLLRRFVYGRPLQLKADPQLRVAVLYLLDVLVESGSSAAYRMRDDFVTPAN